MKHIKKIIILTITVAFLFAVFGIANINRKDNLKAEGYIKSVDLGAELEFDEIIDPFSATSIYLSYTEFKATIATPGATAAQILAVKTQGKKIRFDTALELYQFSVDVCAFNTRNYSNNGTQIDRVHALLSLDYVLGNDIDYLDTQGKAFMPIGYNYEDDDGSYSAQFTGTFDGRGFEIRNLYLADYDELVIILEERDIVVTPYYSMFSFNSGVIKNFGLLDPHLELRIPHDAITKASHIVGENTGTVEHVFVVYRDKEAGIKMRPQLGQTTSSYEAAGIVYANKGIFKDAYYAGEVVINKMYIKNFDVQPVLFTNDGGTIESLVYDSTRYALTLIIDGQPYSITPVNSYHTAKTTTELKTNGLNNTWFYYPSLRYPAQFGLKEDASGNLKISNGVEFIYFNKLIRLNYYDLDNIYYRNHNSILTGNIDLRDVASNAYITPSQQVSSKINGNNFHIGYINIQKGLMINEDYYAGLFSVFSGELINVTINNAVIDLNTCCPAPKLNCHTGLIAGTLVNAKIENVKIDASVSLGTKSPKSVNLGVLAGDGYGLIKDTYISGDLTANTISDPTDLTDISYYIGGVIGRSPMNQKLILNRVLYVGDIRGPVSNHADPIQKLTVYLGGVIGHTFNTIVKDDYYKIMNAGVIKLEELNASNLTYYAGGVIGYSEGRSYILSDNNRNWYHRGTFINNIANINTTTKKVYVSGVTTANHIEATEFISLFNEHLTIEHNSQTYSQMLIDTYKNSNLVFTPLINSLSTYGITVSQSLNKGDQEYDYFIANYGIIKTNGPSLLRFVENQGDVLFRDFDYNYKLVYSGITTNYNIDYLNVINTGDITLQNLTNISTVNISPTPNQYFDSADDVSIRVSGITEKLTTDKYLKNSYNEGKIIIANVNLNSANLYVGGLVVENQAGDLQNQDDSAMPKATKGIINSINYGDITSTKSSSIYGITGRGNTFVGGITSLNKGSIQDTINEGKITFYNKFASPIVEFDEAQEQYFAGLIESFQSGIVVGGIAASITAATSRVFDTSNGGDIIGVSKSFVRSGGIVAQSLPAEIVAGKVYQTADANISDSIISNGINYNDVLSITNDIGTYSNTSASQEFYIRVALVYQTSGSSLSYQTTVGTQQRLGIYASAGGVIGYGLSKMRRMINHGRIISTDTAGGVVGATFVLGGETSTTTYVKIDTAINYGEIRAYKAANYNNFDKINFNIDSLGSNLYDVNADFIFPSALNYNHMRTMPRHKRGIGGVFGRLQRGVNGIMQGNGTDSRFDFVVNMNKDVDLIGRMDQVYNFSSSANFFDFRNAKYYSARQNDTTSVSLTGFYVRTREINASNQSSEIKYDQLRYLEYNEGARRYRQYQGYGTQINRQRTGSNWWNYNYVKNRGIFLAVGRGYVNEGIGMYSSGGGIVSQDNNLIWRNLQPRIDIGEANPDLADTYFPSPNGKNVGAKSFAGNVSYNPYTEYNSYKSTTLYELKEVPWVSENTVIDTEAINVYHPAFEMRNEKTILTNNQPITSYISYATNEILGQRFKTVKPDGMYVLASSSGSIYGSTLPINTKLNQLGRLDGEKPFDIDYESPEHQIFDPATDPKYQQYVNLFQVALNDKSRLLTTNQTLSFLENNSNYMVTNPTINHTTRVITINYNMTLLETNQSVVNFSVDKATLPLRAFIAAPYDSSQWPDKDAFRDDLKIESLTYPNRVASQDNYPPELTFDFSTNPGFTFSGGKWNTTNSEITYTIGSFRSYSEAALADSSLMDIFHTDYEVQVRFIKAPTTVTIRAISYSLDGQANVTIPSGADLSNYVIATSFNQSVRVNHRDSTTPKILNIGYDFTPYIKLYYRDTGNVEHLVSSDYYQIESIPVYQNGTYYDFASTIIFSEDLRGGTYLIKYKYYESDAEKIIQVTKNKSSLANIEEFKHEYSLLEYNPSTNITTTIPFLYQVDASQLTIEQTTVSSLAYLDNIKYSTPFLEVFEISPFAKLLSINSSKTYVNGYVRYTVTYVIEAEDETLKTYVHTLDEEHIALTSRYINGTITEDLILKAEREAESTQFGLYYSEILPEYQPIFYSLDSNDDAYLTLELTTPNEGITFFATSATVDVLMDYTVDPGDYTVNIKFIRKDGLNTHEIDLGSQDFQKLYGSRAYLNDITFSAEGTELGYPDVYIIDSSQSAVIEYGADNTNPLFRTYNESYSPIAFYAGINYDGADLAHEQHVRIIGEIDNIDLNSYAPNLLEYLPIGATISRLYYDETINPVWTTPIGKDATPAELATLTADYTLYPRDQTEPDENSEEDIIITYKVTSEDGLNTVYYYISVLDTTYNITFIFNIFYMDNGVKKSINSIDTFNTIPILVEVSNLDTTLPFLEAKLQVSDFPTFSTIVNYQNQMRMYYQAIPEAQENHYRFRFARNRAGFYSFSVDLPTNYKYEIEYNGDELNDVSDYVEGAEGKYFYINQGIRTRTRRLEIIIYDQAYNGGWGLHDNDKTYQP